MTSKQQLNEGWKLYQHAKTLIPGGVQLFSKRPELYLPEHWPCYFSKVKGIHVQDAEGNEYRDMSHNAVGTCVLGAADPDVNAAVQKAIMEGTMSSLNCIEEVKLAERMLGLHPWADMVRYARTGGEIMSVAVRIARASTGRDKVAFCGYHGWHDWYLSANLADERALDGHLLSGLHPSGVPRTLHGSALPFRYNDLDGFQKIIDEHGAELAAVVMEPIRDKHPEDGFLEKIRESTSKMGIILVFDEITAAFRLTCGGAHLTLGVEPDMASFGKTLGNGYPMSMLIGRREIMEASQSTFISSSYWTERIGPVATLAMIDKFERCNVAEHLISLGRRLQEGWQKWSQDTGLALDIGGIFPLSHFSFTGEDALCKRTLFTQQMLKRAYLATPAFYLTYAHRERDIEEYLQDGLAVCQEIARAESQGCLEALLEGSVVHSGFQRLT